MEIKIDVYLQQDSYTRIIHDTVTENDIIQLIEKRIADGDLGIPMHFDKEKVKITVSIDTVTI